MADHVDFTSTTATSLIHMKGHVVVHESSWTIKGDELFVDTRERKARSPSFVLIDNGSSAAAGASGSFDFEEKTGILDHSHAESDPWHIDAKTAKLGEGRRLEYRNARVTSCDYLPPHYHLWARRLTIVPKQYMVARHAVFWIGPVPVFYTPFFYKSLNPTPFIRFKVQPGYDHRNGAFAKGTVYLDLAKTLYSKLYLDYYSVQGLGLGGELQRRAGEDSRGVISVYRIHEHFNSRELGLDYNGKTRWSVLGEGYHAVTKQVAVQGRMQAQSDPNFNNDYARSSYFRVTPDLVNDAAIVYKRPLATTRLSYSRLDVALSTASTKFIRTHESGPRLDVNSASLRFWKLPWLNTLTGFADNFTDVGVPYLEQQAGAGWQGTRAIPLFRGASFTPTANYGETYYNRLAAGYPLNTVNYVDAFIGRYSGSGNLRLGTFLGTWDLTHAYAARQKPNAVQQDAAAVDKGVEANLTTLQDTLRPTRRTMVRVVSGYDFRTYRDHIVPYLDRYQPIVGDFSYAPSPDLAFSMRDDYQINHGNQSFLGNVTLGNELANFLTLSSGYSLGASDLYYLNTEFGYAPSSGTWRLLAALRSDVVTPGGVGELRRFRVFEKEITLFKSWHDFYGRLFVRLRPGGVKEGMIRVDWKLPERAPKEHPVRKDWESEWFPERGKAGVDRP